MMPSEAFRQYFGPEHGVELPVPGLYAYRKGEFAGEDGGRVCMPWTDQVEDLARSVRDLNPAGS